MSGRQPVILDGIVFQLSGDGRRDAAIRHTVEYLRHELWTSFGIDTRIEVLRVPLPGRPQSIFLRHEPGGDPSALRALQSRIPRRGGGEHDPRRQAPLDYMSSGWTVNIGTRPWPPIVGTAPTVTPTVNDEHGRPQPGFRTSVATGNITLNPFGFFIQLPNGRWVSPMESSDFGAWSTLGPLGQLIHETVHICHRIGGDSPEGLGE